MKNFVGGYYDDRVFKGDFFDGKTPFSKKINTYTLEEVLNLGFVEGVKEWFEEIEDKDFDEASEKEKIEAIINYTEHDEMAGMLYFDTEEKAEKYKKEVLEELEELEEHILCVDTEEDEYGIFREIYIYIPKNIEELYKKWREEGEEASEGTDISFTWDCGESSAREDFSNYIGLEMEIPFEEMLELERDYERNR